VIDQRITSTFRGFYSDPHFGHKNIISFCDRPFANVQVQTDELILRYNKLIKPDDWVLWLGDVFFSHSAWEGRNVLERMNGQKVLVKGNHDGSDSKMLSMGFALVVPEMHIMIADKLCKLSHYPYALTPDEVNRLKKEGKHVDLRYAGRRPKRVKDEILIHGHTHSAEKYRNNMVHVGVDAWNYGPALMEEVASIVEDL